MWESYFFCSSAPGLVFILTLKDIDNKITFDGSVVGCVLCNLSAYDSSSGILPRTHLARGVHHLRFQRGGICNTFP